MTRAPTAIPKGTVWLDTDARAFRVWDGRRSITLGWVNSDDAHDLTTLVASLADAGSTRSAKPVRFPLQNRSRTGTE